jgi:hypothetical protein
MSGWKDGSMEGGRETKDSQIEINAHIPLSKKRMRKTWRTGSSERVSASMILRSDLMRPKMRRTRSARRMRTMPVDWLAMTDASDMATIKASSMDLAAERGRGNRRECERESERDVDIEIGR